MIALFAIVADLCAAPPESATADTQESAAYSRAGDEAIETGDLRIATIAYRKAVAFDPANDHARQALAALCQPDDGALLAAIARFREGDLDRAHTELTAIVARDSTSAGAHLFLGLIALGRHDGALAERELALASTNSAYAAVAGEMQRFARREGRLTVVALVAPEIDTNPQLVPDTPPLGATAGSPTPDEALLLATTVTVRPTPWLVLRDGLAWHDQRKLSSLTFLGENAQAAIERDHHANHAAVRYDLDLDWLGGAQYLVAHRGTASYRRDFSGFALAGTYSVRHRAYQQLAQADFTGWVYSGDESVLVHATPRVDLEIKTIGWREVTVDPAFSALAGGAQVMLRGRPMAGTRAAFGASSYYARYDGAEPDGLLRRDLHGEITADLDVDLSDHWIAIASASLIGNRSTVEDFRYWKLVARLGLELAFGGP
ncbi:MAG: Tetratricopeptide 2 repeat protein [Myxococcales bacterium]|nr:Tetratricopeptide 2 repeat protein [Myxococcales bacterium]